MSHPSALLPLFPDTAEIRDGVLWIGGCSTVELAEEYGTPLYLYCEETIRNQARSWRAGAPDATIVYGTKAFPDIEIMKILWEEGIGADVSTLGEMLYAKAAGIPPSHWVVHGNNKSDEELRFAAENDAWLVVMDEPGEVERCVAAGVKRVLLRITPGIEADTHEKIMTGHLGSKFGVSPEEAPEIVERARAAGLEFLGLHVHLGSQLTDDSAVRAALARLEEIGGPWPILDLGGGLGIRYTLDDAEPPAPDEYVRGLVESLADPRPQIVFEPGRSLVGRSGVALYRVGVVKRSGATTWVAVDGGMSDNPRPALYGARYSALLAGRADQPGTMPVALCGKHCESGDVLIERVTLPEPHRGETVAVPGSGAYALSMGSRYNAVPEPAVVLVGQGDGARKLPRWSPGT